MANGITKPNVEVRPTGLTEDQKRAVRRVARQSAGKTDWTKAEARAEGLPPYYARDWFVWELYRLRSLAAMEAE